MFKDDEDRRRFLETLGEVCAKTGWQVNAYCLMPAAGVTQWGHISTFASTLEDDHFCNAGLIQETRADP